jgi:hypothetical protein
MTREEAVEIAALAIDTCNKNAPGDDVYLEGAKLAAWVKMRAGGFQDDQIDEMLAEAKVKYWIVRRDL